MQLLTGDVVADPLLPVDGALRVRRSRSTAARLAALAAAPDRPAHWRGRLDAVAALLDAEPAS